MIELAMASFTKAADRQRVNQWFSKAEGKIESLAHSALELAAAWRAVSGISDAELQALLQKTLPPLPGTSETERKTQQRRWREELRALIFRPAHHHWPVTESLDRGRLAARIRAHLHAGSRNLSLALGLVLALLALLLIAIAG